MAIMLRAVSGGILGIGAALFFVSLFVGHAFYSSDGSGDGGSKPLVWLVQLCFLCFCFLTSFSVQRSRSLLSLGGIVHGGNFCYSVRATEHRGYFVLSLLLATLWFLMWRNLKPNTMHSEPSDSELAK